MNKTNQSSQTEYRIGIMKIPVEGEDDEFSKHVDSAAGIIEKKLKFENTSLSVNIFQFMGPHLTPNAGTYSPLDFLRIGLSENVFRNFHLLIIVTEVDLTSSKKPYVFAMPSPLTNISILSTKRLSPEFWSQKKDKKVAVSRIAALILHSIGHLLNIPHSNDPHNFMFDITRVEDLDKMNRLTKGQLTIVEKNLPIETHDTISKGNPMKFVLAQILANRAKIFKAVKKANPFNLAFRLPTMIATGLSVTVVLFFSSETWDVASTVDLYQLVVFAFVSVIIGIFMLYRAFTFGAVSGRSKELTESIVVTEAASFISLLLTILLLLTGFFALWYFSALSIFPDKLKESWPTVDPAIKQIDNIKLALFLSSMGILTGSLGGKTESKNVIRSILFLSEET